MLFSRPRQTLTSHIFAKDLYFSATQAKQDESGHIARAWFSVLYGTGPKIYTRKV